MPALLGYVHWLCMIMPIWYISQSWPRCCHMTSFEWSTYSYMANPRWSVNLLHCCCWFWSASLPSTFNTELTWLIWEKEVVFLLSGQLIEACHEANQLGLSFQFWKSFEDCIYNFMLVFWSNIISDKIFRAMIKLFARSDLNNDFGLNAWLTYGMDQIVYPIDYVNLYCSRLYIMLATCISSLFWAFNS